MRSSAADRGLVDPGGPEAALVSTTYGDPEAGILRVALARRALAGG